MIAELKSYEKYQAAAAGLPPLPAHWALRRTKSLLREIDRRSKTGTQRLLSLRMNAGLVDHHAMGGKHIPASSLVGYKHVLPGELVMNRMRAAIGLFGGTNSEGLVSPDYAIFDVRPELKMEYAVSLFKTPMMASLFRLESRGLGTGESGFLRLYSDRFGIIRMPLPPFDEQEAIVRFLDHANRRIDQFIRAKKKLIALLIERKQAIIHLAVTRGLDSSVPVKPSGVPWLGDIPQHWEVVPSKALFKHRREKADCGDEVLTASQSHGIISRSSFMSLEGRRVMQVFKGADILKHVEPNDFVMSMRSFEGGLEWSKIRGAVSSAYVVLTPTERVYCPFFAYVLKSKYFIGDLRRTSDLVRDGQALRYANFGQVPLPLVPWSEQVAIADHLSRQLEALHATVSRLHREIELVREHRTRLASDVVTGQLDVRTAAASLPNIEPEAEPLDEDEGQIDIEDGEAA